MAIGDRISERLSAKGISQAELARRIKVDQSTINGLIRGTAKSTKYLHRIARELETTSAYLSEETDDPFSEAPADEFTSEERRWVDLLRSLEPINRKAALQLVQAIATSAPSPSVHGRGR